MLKYPKLLLTTLLVMTICSTTLADEPKVLQNFDAVLIITNDLRLESKWNICPDMNILPIHTVDRVYKGETVDCRILLRNVSADQTGHYQVTFDIEVTNPVGKSYIIRKDMVGLTTPPVKKELIFLAKNSLRLNFQDSDPFGKYQIKISVYDHCAQKMVVSENDLTLIAYGTDQKELAESEIPSEVSNYYQKPDSHIILLLFKLVFTVEELQGTGDYTLKMSALFRTCFKDNPYLIPHFVDYIQSLDYHQRRVIYPIIKGVSIDYPNLLTELITSEEERKAIEAIPYPDIWDNSFQDIRQLDMLWLSFFASGDIGPIRQIIKAVKLAKEQDDYRVLIGNEAIRSLTDHCKQHRLVKAYCVFIYRQEHPLDEFTKKTLLKCITGR